MPTEHVYSGPFAFTDALQRQGACELRLFRLESGAYLAIATDLDQGPSVTNAAEEIATQVRHRFLQPGQALLYIEHYRRRRLNEDETFDKVWFHWDGRRYVEPEWKASSK